jgi:hypothetical protein
VEPQQEPSRQGRPSSAAVQPVLTHRFPEPGSMILEQLQPAGQLPSAVEQKPDPPQTPGGVPAVPLGSHADQGSVQANPGMPQLNGSLERSTQVPRLQMPVLPSESGQSCPSATTQSGIGEQVGGGIYLRAAPRGPAAPSWVEEHSLIAELSLWAGDPASSAVCRVSLERRDTARSAANAELTGISRHQAWGCHIGAVAGGPGAEPRKPLEPPGRGTTGGSSRASQSSAGNRAVRVRASNSAMGRHVLACCAARGLGADPAEPAAVLAVSRKINVGSAAVPDATGVATVP